MSNSHNIIGRTKEIEALDRLYKSSKSEFLMVFGRRRVGKTYLLTRHFENQFSFRIIGQANTHMAGQLQNFHAALSLFDETTIYDSPPRNWFEAFQRLIKSLDTNQKKRKVLLFDELPWLDTHRSDFLGSLEHFWNSWAALRSDILLIGCGSAASWMINKLIRNRGGLHNRVTERMQILPFTLVETEAFLQSKGAGYDRYQLLQLYMVMGGIPFYLENIQTNRSVAQNIDRMFFSTTGLLRTEYHDLYRSLFKHHERHLDIVEVLAQKVRGISRAEIVKKSSLTEGGSFSRVLAELEQSGFIQSFYPFGKTNRDAMYRLTDPYTLFYFSFVKNSKAVGDGAWLARLGSPKWRAWSGYAFEDICKYHTMSIKKALGIQAVYTETSIWQSQDPSGGAQIDLLLDRNDRIINVCEIKFAQETYTITKRYSENLRYKIAAFRAATKTKKTVLLTMITTYGLTQNKYVQQLVSDDLTMDMLFE